ncbi:MAG: hypothetical protein COT74_02200 [Bdellovibrionales bacterium CG10_big_fil_rev_8_21_14_0_10_45_34]|nr:MAG: hypothetical protein COT74_02200 [Bdellovibrionales bacterium CG10_big_fil_rev_8_21_14_0_10_45_34]
MSEAPKEKPSTHQPEHSNKKKEGGSPQQGGKVLPLVVNDRCVADGCKSKQKRAQFCSEHFVWFKEGLISKHGQKPKDFERKYTQFLAKQKQAA